MITHAAVARQAGSEAATPSRRASPVRGDALEHLVEVPPMIAVDGIIALSAKRTSGHFPKARNFMNSVMRKKAYGISSTDLLYGTASGKRKPRRPLT